MYLYTLKLQIHRTEISHNLIYNYLDLSTEDRKIQSHRVTVPDMKGLYDSVTYRGPRCVIIISVTPFLGKGNFIATGRTISIIEETRRGR